MSTASSTRSTNTPSGSWSIWPSFRINRGAALPQSISLPTPIWELYGFSPAESLHFVQYTMLYTFQSVQFIRLFKSVQSQLCKKKWSLTAISTGKFNKSEGNCNFNPLFHSRSLLEFLFGTSAKNMKDSERPEPWLSQARATFNISAHESRSHRAPWLEWLLTDCWLLLITVYSNLHMFHLNRAFKSPPRRRMWVPARSTLGPYWNEPDRTINGTVPKVEEIRNQEEKRSSKANQNDHRQAPEEGNNIWQCVRKCQARPQLWVQHCLSSGCPEPCVVE